MRRVAHVEENARPLRVSARLPCSWESRPPPSDLLELNTSHLFDAATL